MLSRHSRPQKTSRYSRSRRHRATCRWLPSHSPTLEKAIPPRLSALRPLAGTVTSVGRIDLFPRRVERSFLGHFAKRGRNSQGCDLALPRSTLVKYERTPQSGGVTKHAPAAPALPPLPRRSAPAPA